MKLEEIRTLEDVQAFLEGTQAVVFEVIDSKAARYRWIERVLIRVGTDLKFPKSTD